MNVNRVIEELEDEVRRLYQVEELYYDLLCQVERKFPGERRHDTARRYIIDGERGRDGCGSVSSQCVEV
jgi:hypothetical protein